MRLVLFAPGLLKSAIGRVALLVEGELRALGHHVTLVRTETEVLLEAVPHPFGCAIYAWNAGAPVEQAIRDADAIVYHIGDNYEFHRGALEWLPTLPGIVCLHDFFLGHLFWAWATGRRDRAIEVLDRWYGPQVAQAFFAYGSNREFIAGTHRDAPLTEWIADMATGVITHSSWGGERILHACAGPVRVVPLAYAAPSRPPAAPSGAIDGTFRLLTVGHVNANKRATSVIGAIAADPLLRRAITYRIVGHSSPEAQASLTELAEQLGVRLIMLGEVPDETLAEELAASDAAVCLRWPSLEAASASAIEAMLAAKPIIVTDTGFYAELPDRCVLKVDPQDEIAGIRGALSGLVADRATGPAMGLRAAAWANTTFSAANYARHTIAMARLCDGNAAIQAGVRHLCGFLSDWSGSAITPAALDPIATSLSIFNSRPPRRPNILQPDRPLVFLHIEKTAGTEFVSYLSEHFAPDMIAKPYFGGSMADYFGRREKLFYHGHYGYDQTLACNITGYLLTFLRSPISRIFSHYKSWHNPANLTEEWLSVMPPRQAALLRGVHEMTFEEFVLNEDPEIEAVLRNLMSHRLARNPWASSPDLDSALEVLEQDLFWFGITEHFELSIRLLQGRLDSCRAYIRHDYNKSPEYSSYIGDAARQRLIEFNTDDQRLYDFAVDLFEQRCKEELGTRPSTE